MIDVFYTKIKAELPAAVYTQYLNRIPALLQERNVRFRKWNDRHSNLFGKILLLEALQQYGYAADCLNHLTYNQYNRPYLFPEVDFNISHSGDMVVCAIGAGVRLGIDIEKIDPVDFNDFVEVMTADQWSSIKESASPYETFFSYWAMKESMIKADSRGMSIALTDIHIHNNIVRYDNEQWYLTRLYLDDHYSCCLATSSESPAITLHYKEYPNISPE